MNNITKLFFTVLLAMLGFSAQAESGFTLWQLPMAHDVIGNSYVIRTDNGKVLVMDGGHKSEEMYLRGFIAALGNEVEAWIVSHPHNDHVGALTEILKDPRGIKIKRVIQSRFSDDLIRSEQPYDKYAFEFYEALDESGVPVENHTEPGYTEKIGGMNMKILGVTNEEIRVNPYNNSSMVFRFWDDEKSMVFLGDLGMEGGNKLLNSPYRPDLDCDYLQIAHHGQRGCDENFYKTVEFRYALWPTTLPIWNNDMGEGYNTGILETFNTRRWIMEKGIEKNYIGCFENVIKIE